MASTEGVVPITVIYPEAVQVQGNTSVLVVQDIANIAAPSLATEINASSSVNVSCHLYSGGAGTSSQNKGEAPRRLCTRDVFQRLGNKTYEVTDLQYVYSPQEADTDPTNAAKAALTEGSTVFLVVRKGLDAQDTAYAVSQVVEVWEVELGAQNRTQTGDGEFDEYSVTQTAVVKRAPELDAVIAA